MKTIKALKITSIINSIFCFFCLASTVCSAIVYYLDIRNFLKINEYCLYGWSFTAPVGIIAWIVCLMIWLVERRSFEARQTIKNKWVWIILWPVIATSILFFSIIVFAWCIGGV